MQRCRMRAVWKYPQVNRMRAAWRARGGVNKFTPEPLRVFFQRLFSGLPLACQFLLSLQPGQPLEHAGIHLAILHGHLAKPYILFTR